MYQYEERLTENHEQGGSLKWRVAQQPGRGEKYEGVSTEKEEAGAWEEGWFHGYEKRRDISHGRMKHDT